MRESTREKVALVSLGCPKNLVDSEIMLAKLSEAGYELTPRAEEAQLVIVNTCGFIESAKKESIDAILQVSKLKESGACRKVVVTGCLSQRYKGELSRNFPKWISSWEQTSTTESPNWWATGTAGARFSLIT